MTQSYLSMCVCVCVGRGEGDRERLESFVCTSYCLGRQWNATSLEMVVFHIFHSTHYSSITILITII